MRASTIRCAGRPGGLSTGSRTLQWSNRSLCFLHGRRIRDHRFACSNPANTCRVASIYRTFSGGTESQQDFRTKLMENALDLVPSYGWTNEAIAIAASDLCQTNQVSMAYLKPHIHKPTQSLAELEALQQLDFQSAHKILRLHR